MDAISGVTRMARSFLLAGRAMKHCRRPFDIKALQEAQKFSAPTKGS
jgi:hypothetical protein